MHGADAASLRRAMARTHALAQAVIADLEQALLEKDIGWLQIAMDDAVIMQIPDRSSERREPRLDQFNRQALRMAIENGIERFTGDVFHHDPRFAVQVGFDVVKAHQVLMLEVQALADAAQLNVGLI